MGSATVSSLSSCGLHSYYPLWPTHYPLWPTCILPPVAYILPLQSLSDYLPLPLQILVPHVREWFTTLWTQRWTSVTCAYLCLCLCLCLCLSYAYAYAYAYVLCVLSIICYVNDSPKLHVIIIIWLCYIIYNFSKVAKINVEHCNTLFLDVNHMLSTINISRVLTFRKLRSFARKILVVTKVTSNE